MPRMPSDRIEGEVRNNVTPIRLTRASGAAPEARALRQAGDVVHEMGSRIRTANIQAEVVDAQFSLRDELDQAYRELERDMEGDPAEFEQRMREKSKEIVSRVGKGMSSPMHKRLWEQAAQKDVESFAIQSRDLTFKRQIDGAKAKTIDAGTKYEAIVRDPSKSREQLEQGYTDFTALVDGQLEAGLYTKAEAAQLKAQAEVNLKSGISLRHVSEIDHRMDNGDFASAEEYFKTNYGEIDPDKREAIEEVIEAKGLASKAVTTADEYLMEADGDYGRALEKARKVKDVDLRLEIEDRLNTMRAQDNAADAERQDEVRMKGMETILAGGTVAGIPASVMREANPDTRQFWNDMIYSRRQREQTIKTLSAQERAALKELQATTTQQLKGLAVTSPEVYLSGPASWQNTAPGMYQRFALLDPSDQQSVLNDIAERKQNGNTQTTVDRAFGNLSEEAERLFPEQFEKNRADSETTLALQGELRRLAEQELRDNGGKPLTTDRVRALVGVAAANVETQKGMLWWKSSEPLRPLTEEEAAREGNIQQYRRALEVSQTYPDFYRAARLKLVEGGNAAPSEFEIANEALAMRDRAARDEAISNAASAVRKSVDAVGEAFGAN